MSEKKKARKWSKIKRWLRSWVFTPLGNVKIKLIDKVERKRQSISDCELNQIVSGALTDRYPCRFFRDRNDRGSTPVRRSLLENEFEALVDLVVPMSTRSESARQQSSRLDSCVANGSVVDGGEPAVATTKPKPLHDPRGSWRGDEYSVLRIMNPDVSWLNSGDEKSEESGSMSVIEVDGNVYELSALGGKSPDLPAELSEETQSGKSRSALVVESGVQMASPLVIEELAPQLPDLYFIHQPDPPLCCLITSALRDSNSPVLFENGICFCDHSSHGTQPVISHLPPSDISRSSVRRAKPPMNTMKFLIRQTQRRRNTIMNNAYISPYISLQPRPLQIRKPSNATSTNTQNDALFPIPAETSHDATAPVHSPSHSLRCKIQHGPLPPLPTATTSTSSTHSSSLGSAGPSSRPPDISSTTPSASASASPVDIPQYPDRPTSMCGGCLAKRHRSLHSHPYHRRGDSSPQFGNPPLPYPLSPQEPTRLPPRVDSLPASLRAGLQCRHCPTRRSGIVSPPVFVGPRPRAQVLNRVSASFSDSTPDSPWAGPVGPMGFYAASEDELPLSSESHSIDETIDSSGLEMCLIAGSRAQSRRYR
ncbi:hypothetical protein N7449_008013 [Penicillium cf. viridicatum]|uniref:Uncharacterized protein n=1 Tax=Penicillium cf. viridicatum TaxID=2972119 RepID=A0A9W9JIF2_9EURO|nr:hypothetical protein N7449_008013 [Penicillium cf. viridicatum]